MESLFISSIDIKSTYKITGVQGLFPFCFDRLICLVDLVVEIKTSYHSDLLNFLRGCPKICLFSGKKYQESTANKEEPKNCSEL